MALILHREPALTNPDMIVGWPGIGNIGLITVDTIRQAVQAEEMGEIEPWDFFYPSKVIIRGSVLTDMEFPTSKFYYKRLANRDIVFFVGEEQPVSRESMYAEGARAYEMANMVLDVAEKFGCGRIYTSGAAVAITHHTHKPRVWAVANQKKILAELKTYPNMVLMSEVEGRGDQGSITGLNGLLVGTAKKRKCPGVCLMGEIPDYLSRVPFPYPKASQAVIEVLSEALNLNVDPHVLDGMIGQMDTVLESVYQQFPAEIKERLEQRKETPQAKPRATITEEDQKWLKEHIDDFFKKGDKGV
ncbi:MAG: PAC2 family protein [Dehalococcoidia bacterium]|nr:PAC2 family protein [Dehalococcoidia bacterium]